MPMTQISAVLVDCIYEMFAYQLPSILCLNFVFYLVFLCSNCHVLTDIAFCSSYLSVVLVLLYRHPVCNAPACTL